MESLEMRIFREVAYAQSISGAAEKMGYVQSNVTAHIRKLEEELNTELFLRHSKGVSLTEAGERLLSYAEQVIRLLDNAKSQFAQNPPSIHIGATQTIAAHRLPVWLSAFQKQYPQVGLSVTTGLQADLIQSVADGHLDCAFVNTEFHHPGLVSAFSFQEALVLIAPKNLNYDQIPHQPIVAATLNGCPYRKLLEAWVIQKTSRQPAVIPYDTVEGIMKAVSLGLGISLLPRNVLPEGVGQGEGIQSFPADDMGVVYVQLVLSKIRSNPAVDGFLTMIQAHSGL